MSNAVIVAHLRVDMEDRGGKIDLMLPYATLEPIRDLLVQMFMGERFGRDTIWENHLMSQLWDTDIEIKAVIKETKALLSDISSWKKGSFFPLEIAPDEDISIVCGDVSLFNGTMGRKEDNVVVKINGKAEKK
jgi:flagellar motor switch protein FliM